MNAVLWMAFMFAAQEDWVANRSSVTEPVAPLSEEISLLNLIRGLNLTTDQVRSLAGLSRRAGRVLEDAAQPWDEAAAQYRNGLEQLRKELLKCETPVPT